MVKSVGDWAIDAGSFIGNWSANEPLGLMTYDKKFCLYTLTLIRLRPNFEYKWKIIINNSFKENYGKLIKLITFIELQM